MDPHTAAAVGDWPEMPFSGGHDGLHELAAREFTGAVENAGATLYVLNGRVVGIENGTIDDFETGGTAREAPHDSLPLLYAMRLRDAEVRGRYYTEETPIEEVDRTLRQGGFTGYLELSENVLSGDYYVLYQAGKSTSVAFIGNARRVFTDEEAFERACDEVGIYEVKSVDLDVIGIPGDPDTDDASEESDRTTAVGGVPVGSDEPRDTTDDQPTEAATGTPHPDETAIVDAEAESDSDSGEPDEPTSAAGGTGLDDPLAPVSEDSAESDATAATEEDQVRSVPSVDPGRSEGAEHGTGAEQPAAEADDSATDAELEAVRAELAEREAELDRVREELAATQDERDRLATTVDRLEARVEEIEGELADGPGRDTAGGPAAGAVGGPASGGGGTARGGSDLSVADALAGTNLFVRYGSKSRPTLDDAHDREAAADEVRENLRIEHHTQFESANATVEGRDFEAWLTARPEYRFVTWITGELPFEIQSTRSVASMRKLYDALPNLDRVALDTTVRVGGDDADAGSGNGEEVSFDLVAYNRMGRPLVVADMQASREPVDEAAMASLVKEATVAANSDDHLAGAFFVTESYFDPAALSIAEEATGGSLLSRDKRESFVKLSRSRGFHLGLVENREGSFHLTVPEL